MDTTLVRYSMNDFFKYKDQNNVVEDRLESHCLSRNNYKLLIRDAYISEMDEIVNLILGGVNPNEIAFKNMIRENLNKINKNTYAKYLEALKSVQYTSENNLKILASELIIRSMNDTIASKGFSEDGSNTISDINANLVVDLGDIYIGSGDAGQSMAKVLKSMCQLYFKDFVDPTKALDENNQHRVDNFKGLMNFLGLLFKKNIINNKVVALCAKDMVNMIKNIQVPTSDVRNVFDAYERLINHVVSAEGDQREMKKELGEIHKSIATSRLNRFQKTTYEKIAGLLTEVVDKN